MTEGSLETVTENNDLFFVDLDCLDFGDMVIGTSVKKYIGGLAYGGSGNYTYSIDPSYPLPKGFELLLPTNRHSAQINAAPTEETAADTIRVIVTDNVTAATASIDIAYGDITEAPKEIIVDGEPFTTKENKTGDGWTYTASDKILTLENYDGGVISSEEAVNIVVSGSNTITIPADATGDTFGIKSTAGSVNITGNNDGTEDTLSIVQTGLTDPKATIYAVWAASDIKVTDCNLIIKFEGADATVDASAYGRYGLFSQNAVSRSYFYGTGSLDLDIGAAASGNSTVGNLRALSLEGSGNIDVNIYDKFPEDEKACTAVEGTGGLYMNGTGNVNISVPDGCKAVKGRISAADASGKFTFKGEICTSLVESSVGITVPGNKRFFVKDDPDEKIGIAYKEYEDSSKGYYLQKKDGSKVTEGSLETVTENNDLFFVDLDCLDFGDMVIGTSVKKYIGGLAYGGSGDYTYSIDPEYPLPKGCELLVPASRYLAYINAAPTEETAAGTIRVIVTDNVTAATASIDIAYGDINVKNPVTSVEINKDETTIEAGGTETLTATVLPEHATNSSVTWASSDIEVAAISATGVITAMKPGTATITVETVQGKKKDYCTVIVKEKTPEGVDDGKYIKNLVANADYTVNGAPFTADAQGRIAIQDSWRELTVAIIKVHVAAECNSAPQNLSISKAEVINIETLSNQITLSETSYAYDGDEKTPTVSVKNGDITLVENTDYTVSYANNTDAGTASVIITGNGTAYIGSVTKFFTISEVAFTGITDENYEGAYDKMDHTISLNGVPNGAKVYYKTAIEDEYSLTKPIRVDAGTTTVYYKVIIKNYLPVEGVATITITGKRLNDVTVTLDEETFTYTGEPQGPAITVNDGEKILKQGTDYTLSGDVTGTNADTYDFTINGKGNYEGFKNRSFTIEPVGILDSSAALDKDTFAYTGTAQGPTITVKDGEKTLVAETDYTISGNTSGTAAGTYTFTITGEGNYKGTVDKIFTINPCTHTWNTGKVTKAATCTATGVKTFACTVPGCGETKTETIAIDKNAHPKEKLTTIPAKAATCTATGLTAGEKCSVCGKVTKAQQTIAAKGHSLKTLVAVKATTSKSGKTAGKKCTVCGKVTVAQKTVSRIKTVKLSTATYTYNGKVKSPSLVIKDANGKTLKNKVDYTYSKPSGRKSIGKYTYTVKFKGNYSGTKKLTLTIKPVKPTLNTPKAAKKAITVKWKKGKKAQVTGYQVMVATNSKFTKNKKTATVKGYSKVSKKMTKLKAKTKYYVRVRTYKTVKGVKIYSDWSKVKTIKTK